MNGTARRPWPLVVRRARPGDEAQVLSFATHTWNGWDYMPRAWPRWLEANDGVLLVGAVGDGGGMDADGQALDPGQVVAIVRVAMPAAGEAWWEGIRVDPRVRAMDVATDLQVAEFAWSAANGARMVRYATSARNEGSHRLGARGGLKPIAQFLHAEWKPSRAPGADEHESRRSGFEHEVQAEARRARRDLLDVLARDGLVADPSMAERIWRGVSGDDAFNAGARLYEPRPWALEELTQHKFLNHMSLGEVLHAEDADGGKTVAILVADVPAAENPDLDLALSVGMPRATFELVERIRRHVDAPLNFRYPASGALINDFRQQYLDAGWELSDWELHILGRPIDDAHPVPEVDPTAVVLEEPPRAVITPPR